MISYLNDQYDRKKNPKIENNTPEIDDDKITAEALIENSVRQEEKKKLEDTIKDLPKLDNGSLNKFDVLN